MRKLNLLLLLLIPFISQAQNDCEGFYIAKEGMSSTMKSYNAKGKFESSSISTILSRKNIPGGIELEVKAETKDEKDKIQFSSNLTARCIDNVFYMDMKGLIPEETMKGWENMEMSIKGDFLETPSDLKAGQKLKDGLMNIEVSSSGMSMMTMVFEVKNRIVEGFEDITTSAGTFSCAKISYDIHMKMLFNMQLKAVEWLAKGVGPVRVESYRGDKLQGYSELAELKK
ncbi:MAG: hypothetical protein DWQ44_00135 [Bacteroidetes bacterium]|nr:MAG: hypothetical protein DWQ33_05085 [Bacteroidota bacterium]REK06038.1 MAG: hypothetical protein DWQ39_04225 [Bacteroidota bacterium]REK37096.1 MAG: hypothetical protein DWQ44_00135 [Bacteroidota bacterium]REK47511.1 MAG: hypothetical protein DWQ48_12310 [Bacteroidota bacterium]